MGRHTLLLLLLALRLLTLFVMLGCSGVTSPEQPSGDATTTRETIVVDVQTREFLVYMPSGIALAAEHPVVLMFHGTSGDGLKFYNISGWKEKCELEGCIAVFPSSLEYCVIDEGVRKTTTKWNAPGSWEPCAGETLYDDVKFVRAMVAYLEAHYPVDASRIYATGFSNGGSFTSVLWAEASDLFAAVAASAGVVVRPAGTQTRTIPLYVTLGAADPSFPGSPLPLDASVLENPVVAPVIDGLLAELELDDTYVASPFPGGVVFRYTSPASPGAELDFALIGGLEHQYANGLNHPLAYPDLFWEFFRRYP